MSDEKVSKILQIMVTYDGRKVVLFRDREAVLSKLFPARQGFSFAGYYIQVEMVDESAPVPEGWTENVIGVPDDTQEFDPAEEKEEGESGEGVKMCPHSIQGKPDLNCSPDACDVCVESEIPVDSPSDQGKEDETC